MDSVSSTTPVVLLSPSSSALAVLRAHPRASSVEDLFVRLREDADVRTVVVGPGVDLPEVEDLVRRVRAEHPGVGVVLERYFVSAPEIERALEEGVREVVPVGALGALSDAVARSREAGAGRRRVDPDAAVDPAPAVDPGRTVGPADGTGPSMADEQVAPVDRAPVAGQAPTPVTVAPSLTTQEPLAPQPGMGTRVAQSLAPQTDAARSQAEQDGTAQTQAAQTQAAQTQAAQTQAAQTQAAPVVGPTAPRREGRRASRPPERSPGGAVAGGPSSPRAPAPVAQAVATPTVRRPAAERLPARGRVVTVFSAKGGSGTTTFCTNLAAALADGGRRSVVLVDLDLSLGDVAIALNLSPVTTLADAPAPDGEPMGPEALRALLTPHSPGLSALLAPAQPGRAASVPVELVESVLEALRHAVDHVVVDTPTALDGHVLAALDAADTVVLLAALEIPALKHLKVTLETLEQLGLPEERWRVVLNRSDSDVGLAVREVERTLGWRISGMVPSSRDVPLSVNRGVPLVLEQPRHPVSQAVREFAGRELVGGRRPSVVDLREPSGRATARPGTAGQEPRGLVRRPRRPAAH